MVNISPEHYDEVARRKTPLIGPGSERRVPSGAGGTRPAEDAPGSTLTEDLIGRSVRLEFRLENPTQLRRDIDEAIKALTTARNVLTQLDRTDRSLLMEAKWEITGIAKRIGWRARQGKNIT